MSDEAGGLGRRRVTRDDPPEAPAPVPSEEAAAESPAAAAAAPVAEDPLPAGEEPASGPPRLLVALLAAGLLAVAWAVGLALEGRGARSAAGGEGEPRVRIALIEAAPEVVVGLEGAWRAEPDVGEPLLLEDAGDVTLRPLGGGLRGLALAAGSGVGFPEAGALTLRPVGADPLEPAPAFVLGGRQYRGFLTVRLLADGALAAVSSVGIEDYLAGVIGHEMPISWEDAALEAQAIASRTYALANLKPDAPHDLLADVRSQVYRGVLAEDARARALVAATRGQVVAHGGDLVVTYFHSTCGGDTVPAPWIFEWVKQESEPLSGASDCPCQASRYYRWEAVVDPAEKGLEVALPLAKAEVTTRPRGGYVETLRLTGADGEVLELGHWEARRRLGLRSYAFEAQPAEGGAKLRLTGRGWGHGVGMCQFGANARARQGWDAEAILRHYYPGTTVDRLEY